MIKAGEDTAKCLGRGSVTRSRSELQADDRLIRAFPNFRSCCGSQTRGPQIKTPPLSFAQISLPLITPKNGGRWSFGCRGGHGDAKVWLK